MNTVYSLIETHGLWALGIGFVVVLLYFGGRALFKDRGPSLVVLVIAAASLYVVTRGAILPLIEFQRGGVTTARTEPVPVADERLTAALERYLPGFRAKLAAEVRDTSAHRGSAAARTRLHRLTLRAVAKVLKRTAAHAADRPLIRLMRTQVEILRQLRSAQSGDCYHFAGRPTEERLRGLIAAIPADTKMRLYASIADVIESSGRDHAAPMADAKAMRLIMKIAMRVRRTVGRNAIKAMINHRGATANMSRRAVCGAQIAVMEEILDLPEAQAGGLLRWLLAKSLS